MLDFLRRLFVSPSSFDNDPWGFVENQAGHLIIGAFLAWLLPLPVALLVYAAWEAAQWAFAQGKAWDGAEDAAFAFAGALALSVPLVLIPAGLHLVAGFLRRR